MIKENTKKIHQIPTTSGSVDIIEEEMSNVSIEHEQNINKSGSRSVKNDESCS